MVSALLAYSLDLSPLTALADLLGDREGVFDLTLGDFEADRGDRNFCLGGDLNMDETCFLVQVPQNLAWRVLQAPRVRLAVERAPLARDI